MSDADIGVHFSTPGLAKAQSGLKNMSKDADKLKVKEKELGLVTKKTTADFVQQEKVKAAERVKQISLINAERKEELRLAVVRKQKLFGALGKVGGRVGTASSGIGEGIGVGGGIGAVAGIAAVGAMVVQAIYAQEKMAADNIIATKELVKSLLDTTKSMQDIGKNGARGLLDADFGVKRQLQSQFGNIGSIEHAVKKTNDQGIYSSVLSAQKSGVLDAVGGKEKLLELFMGAKDFGLNSSDVLSNLNQESLSQLKSRGKSGTLDFRAIGANNFQEFSQMNSNIQSFNDTGMMSAAGARDDQRIMNNAALMSIAGSGAPMVSDLKDLYAKIISPQSAAMLEVSNNQLKKLQEISDRMGEQGLLTQGIDSINPFGEGSYAQLSARESARLSALNGAR